VGLLEFWLGLAVVCLDAGGLRALRSASFATCCSADRFGLIFSPSLDQACLVFRNLAARATGGANAAREGFGRGQTKAAPIGVDPLDSFRRQRERCCGYALADRPTVITPSFVIFVVKPEPLNPSNRPSAR
jgi:hypothetical protein